MGDRPLDMISVSDVGDCLIPVFNRPRYFSQRTISLGGDRLTTEEIARAFNKRLANKKFIHPKVVDSFNSICRRQYHYEFNTIFLKSYEVFCAIKGSPTRNSYIQR